MVSNFLFRSDESHKRVQRRKHAFSDVIPLVAVSNPIHYTSKSILPRKLDRLDEGRIDALPC